jgi:hypothetical protein
MSNKPWLIKNSTKEERAKMVRESIVISMLDAPAPTEKAMELYQKYIDGEMEIDEVSEEILKNYKKYID